MRRIALCVVACVSLAGALAQARSLPSRSSSRSNTHKRGTQRHRARKRARKHSGGRHATQAKTASTLVTTTSSAPSGSTLFGDAAIESGLDSNSAGWSEAFPFSNNSSGKASSITVYVAKQNQATKLIAGMYSDSDGNPGSLLTSGTLSTVKRGAWNTISVPSSAISAGRTYWIAILGRGGALYFNDRTGGPCSSQNSAQSSTTALSSTWQSGQKWASCPLSAYVSGTLAPTTISASGSVGTTTTTTSTTTTTPVTVPTLLPPVDLLAPQVSGSAIDGQTVTTDDGSWLNSPTSYSYQWQNCDSSGCANIAGATGSSYTLTSSDLGHTIRSVVTAANAAGAAAATSAQTALVAAAVVAPSSSASPTVSGTGVQGSTLTTSDGSWSGSPTSYTYQWQDCDTSGAGCANIAGAAASSYTLQASDVGNTVRSTVTARNSAGSATASSAATATIIASGGGGGGGSNYTCTAHVTTSTFSSAFSNAGSGAVLCLAPGNYGSFNGASKSAMVVITPDVSAGATAPTGNATGDVSGNVTFSGADFTPAANITLDGVTFSGDVSVSGASHDLLFHDSLFHQHLVITDTSMNNANVTANYDMFPADKADCVGGPEGRIWINESSHTSTPDGVTIENSNIGGSASQCDGVQTGGYGPQILNNWIHDYHYQNKAHTDGVQDYGGSHEVVKGNFMYNVPDCYVSYDGTNHADIEDNICVNDGDQNNGASPNVLVINDDSSSVVKHNTLVAFKDSYGNPGGILMIGSKTSSGSGTVLTDNLATGFDNCENGNCRPYTENHNLFIQGGPGGSGDITGTPVYQGGVCGNLSSTQSPFCSESWSSYLLAASSPGGNAADDGTDMGAYGPGPVTPGGP